MFTKKEDFINEIQYKLGERIDDLTPNSFENINDLVDIFNSKNDNQSWKGLNFLTYYFGLKKEIESIVNKQIFANFDLNTELNAEQKQTVLTFWQKYDIEPIEQSRSKFLNNFLLLYTLIAILGTMLVCTYLITSKDFSGWIYLSGLLGLFSSVFLFKITKKHKSEFKPNTLLNYVKSTYVVRHKTLSKNDFAKTDLIRFIQDELFLIYGKEFSDSEAIPNN